MSILKNWFGYDRVIMFISADYVTEFQIQVLSSGLAKGVESYKTTPAEAARFGIKNPGKCMSVTLAVSHRNKKRLETLKREFDQFVAEDKARRAEEAKLASHAAKRKKEEKGRVRQKAAAKTCGRLTSTLQKRKARIYRG